MGAKFGHPVSIETREKISKSRKEQFEELRSSYGRINP
jgi:hypothetical protein